MVLSEREKMLAGVTAVVAFLILNVAVVGPVVARWGEMNRKIADARGGIDLKRSILGMEPQWLGQHRELLGRLRPGSENGGDVITRVDTVAGGIGVSISSRTPSEPVNRERYIEKSASFKFQSQWGSLVKLLFALTKQPEVYRVTALQLRADNKDPNQLTGDMTIATYYLTAREAAAASAPNSVDSPAAGRQDKP